MTRLSDPFFHWQAGVELVFYSQLTDLAVLALEVHESLAWKCGGGIPSLRTEAEQKPMMPHFLPPFKLFVVCQNQNAGLIPPIDEV